MPKLSCWLIVIDTLGIGKKQMWLFRQRDPWAGAERPSQKILWTVMTQLQFALFCFLFSLLIRLNPEEKWNLLFYVVRTSPFQSAMDTPSSERLGKTMSPPNRGGLFWQAQDIVLLWNWLRDIQVAEMRCCCCCWDYFSLSSFFFFFLPWNK